MRKLSFVILTYAINVFVFIQVAYAQDIQSIRKVENVLKLKAIPFELSDVKLLDSPFKKAMELDAEYLLLLEPDRLLSWFRKEAELESKGEVYGGWEQMQLAGHSLGHYLSACAMMYASTADERFCERVNYIVDELEVCQSKNGTGYVAAIPGGEKMFAEVAKGDIRSAGFNLNGIWSPWYTIHKLFAGLLDAQHYCGNEKALEIAVKFADWAIATTKNLSEEQFQKMLVCEFGGMNESMAELYARTGNENYLELSKRFYHNAVLDPLANHEDKLDGLHSNTNIPKLIGLTRQYELTLEEKYKTAAEFFWNTMTHHHSYVIGGNSMNEYLSQPDKLNDRLGNNTCETCNTYNMLRLTRELFTWNASPEYADYYERALYNHIFSSQNPESGMFSYFVPLRPGAYKNYSDQFNSFWCCVGTGMENHSKYGESIYFNDDKGVWVNLFIPSELNWKEKGIKIKQETLFPAGDNINFTINVNEPTRFNFRIRYPSWAEKEIIMAVNGELQPINTQPGSYIEINRTWNNGDKIEAIIPLSLLLESMPDNLNRVAVCCGPVVLAGELGEINDEVAKEKTFVPVFITEGKKVDDWIKPVDGKALTFQTIGVGKPRDIFLHPFYEFYNKRYSVYWDLFTEEQWQARLDEIKVEQERIKELELLTIDFAQPGDSLSENSHNVKGEKSETGEEEWGRKLRFAYDGGWFSYEIKVLNDKPNTLVCTYWGSDNRRRNFDILIDDVKIASQILDNNKPNEYFDVYYSISEELTKGKEKVTVKFAAQPQNTAGNVFGVRIINAR
ncbi:MAG: beta-L-arabinofuranosidase domain-containing protein [bacterium]